MEPLPHILVGEQQHTVGMVGEGRNAVGVEIGQQGYGHTLVDIDVPEGDGPPCRVTGADGHLVTLGDAGILKEDAELLNVGGQVGIGEGVTPVVAECLFVPLLSHCVLQFFQIMFHRLLFQYV